MLRLMRVEAKSWRKTALISPTAIAQESGVCNANTHFRGHWVEVLVSAAASSFTCRLESPSSLLNCSIGVRSRQVEVRSPHFIAGGLCFFSR
jgi:hypothetical protein